MFRRLSRRRAEVLIELGRPILGSLEADLRLADAAIFMRTVQDELEAKTFALQEALEDERKARVQRDEDHRVLAYKVREFGLIALAYNGYHPREDPFVQYFPEGFGGITQSTAAALWERTSWILTALEQESVEMLLAYRATIGKTFEQFVASEKTYQVARQSRQEAFSLVQAEKRAWIRGVIKTRSLAEYALHYERAYVRGIFAGIRRRRRKGEEVAVETGSEPVLPAEVAVVPPALAPAAPEPAAGEPRWFSAA